MMHDPLERLLRRADATAGAPPAPAAGDLARRVRHEVVRRRCVRVRAIAAAAAPVAALLLVAVVLHVRPTRPELARSTTSTPQDKGRIASDPDDVARLADRIAALRVQVAAHEAVANAMVRREAIVRGTPPPRPAIDPIDRILAERDRGARALVRQADRRYRDLDAKAAAVAAYGRVVALFPNSPWATVARQRLSEIGGS